MPNLLKAVFLAVTVLASAWTQASELTAMETTWLKAAKPVLSFAVAQNLPVEILVQPQDTPGQTPMGMAYLNGRCVLVLSMRGNPEAQSTLDSIPAALRGPVLESIAAHEMGHCWRRLHRTWGTLPKGLQEMNGFSRVTPEQADLLREMWNTRREEGFADLVGLAWTLENHPEHYEAVHAWTVRLRAEQPVRTGPHDTRVWVRLAGDKTRFKPAASIFERAEPVWVEGLLASD